MKTRTYSNQTEADAAIKEWFTWRNEARAQHPKRISIKRELADMKPNGDIVFAHTYKGETVTQTVKAYETEVKYG